MANTVNMTARKLEKAAFLRAFKDYMIPYVRDSWNKQLIIKKDKSNTVFFEFNEEDGCITRRKFDSDLIFSYNIAVEAIFEKAKKEGDIRIAAYDDYAIVNLL